jgi:tRNA nucleotidyltransferase (CCA-adding enzyme)
MNTNEYLQSVLKSQDLPDDSDELKELQSHRKDVEALLRKEFADSSPTIRYGGSRAKGTLILEYYDLDIICYFPYDDMTAGETLEDIFNNVEKVLSTVYYVEKRTSALRLKSRDPQSFAKDFHIDVVPGRFTDDKKADAFIHQNAGDKKRLKTNLDVHIQHVKESGVLDAIRLLKLWKVRRGLRLKQFAFELFIIDLLAKKKNSPLSDQLQHVWTELRDRSEAPAVADPANPTGNDLTSLLNAEWPTLSATAGSTLATIQAPGWEAIFGKVEEKTSAQKTAALRSAAATVTAPTRPWLPKV